MILIALIHLAKFLEVASDSYYKELILRLKLIYKSGLVEVSENVNSLELSGIYFNQNDMTN